jgi:acetyltransferase-like isoleucine patch superfamily enzyme
MFVKLEHALDSPSSLDPHPTPIEQEGEGHEILVASDAVILTRIIVRGQGNRLIIEAGATIAAFAPAGFSPTVPDGGVAGPHALVIEGEGNTVRIGARTRLGLNMTVRGRDNQVEIGQACHLHGFVNVLCSNARLAIGARTTMVQGSIQLHEPGEILFGEDCMISSQVYVSLSDIHPIFDRATGQRINPAASIHVGDHVWAGLRCMILKGAQVGDGAIIAAGSIVSGLAPSNAVVAGSPARTLRENVEWRRDFSESISPAETSTRVEAPPARRRWRLFRPAT